MSTYKLYSVKDQKTYFVNGKSLSEACDRLSRNTGTVREDIEYLDNSFKEMKVAVHGITDAEADVATRYFRKNGRLPKYMTRPEMETETGISDAKCKKIMKALTGEKLVQMLYAIYCPECGKLADKQTMDYKIHRSGYRCPWCGAEIRFERKNFGKLYAPYDSIGINKLEGLKIVSGS